MAPSAIGMSGELYVEGGVKKPYEVPRALEASELPGIAKAFATAAKRAVHEAGFDGVEIHAGNGYLLQQFLGQATNQRSDQYGGSVANRARLLLEVLDACAAEVGQSGRGVVAVHSQAAGRARSGSLPYPCHRKLRPTACSSAPGRLWASTLMHADKRAFVRNLLAEQ